MLDIIFLLADFALFLLSFIFLIRDVKSYEEEKNTDFKSTVLPKNSQFAIMFGLLALIVAVINSLFYV